MASLIALCLCTFPFYGIDLLFGKPFGILPEERSLRGTLLFPNKMSDLEWFLFQNKYALTKQSDLTPWDTGLYLQPNQSGEEEDLFTQFPSFEQLNREADYAWTTAPKRMAGNRAEGSRSLGKLISGFFSQDQVTRERNAQKVEKPGNTPSFETTRVSSSQDVQQRSGPASFSIDSIGDENGIDGKGNGVGEEKTDRTVHHSYDHNDNRLHWRPLLKEDDPETDLYNDQENRKRRDRSAIKERAKEDLDIDFLVLQDQKLSLSPFFDFDIIPPEPIQKLVEKRFYNTIAYKRALNFDIDLFISRQPKEYLLSQKEEIELLEKRQSLAKYYDTLRAYDNMPDVELFNEYFGGSKSYANKFYNQQFKGTLKIVRKLFSIHLNQGGISSPLRFDQPLFLDKGNKIPIFHEELFKQRDKKEASENDTFTTFLRGAGSRPLYAGWDEQSKKLLLTNRFLSRSSAGQELLISEDQKSQYPTLKSLPYLTFASWPMPRKIFSQHRNIDQLANTYNLMYQINPLEEKPLGFEEETIEWRMETTPKNYGPFSVDPTELVIDPIEYIWNIFPPDRGGILWPGSRKVRVKIKKLFNSNSDSVLEKKF
jgi:hypothetical protein